jgi:hypothetical protein
MGNPKYMGAVRIIFTKGAGKKYAYRPVLRLFNDHIRVFRILLYYIIIQN